MLRITICLLALTLASPASAKTIVTTLGIFPSCSEAYAFRDGALAKMLDEQWQRYQSGVQTRVNEAVVEMKKQAAAAQADYEKATAEQRKELLIGAVRIGVYKLIGKYVDKGLPKDLSSSLSKSDLEMLERIATKSAQNAELTVNGIRGKVDPLDVATNSAAQVASILASFLGPVAVKTTEFLFDTQGLLFAYIHYEPEKNFQKASEKMFNETIKKMIDGSPDSLRTIINDTRSKIDKECGGK